MTSQAIPVNRLITKMHSKYFRDILSQSRQEIVITDNPLLTIMEIPKNLETRSLLLVRIQNSFEKTTNSRAVDVTQHWSKIISDSRLKVNQWLPFNPELSPLQTDCKAI